MKLDSLAEKLQFESSAQGFVKTWNGYEISLSNYRIPGSFSNMPMMMIVLNQTLDKTMKKTIAKACGFKGFLLESAGLKENVIVTGTSFKDKDKLHEFLDKLTGTLTSLGLKPLNYCPFCGNDDPNSTRVIRGAILHVHEGCVQSFVDKASKKLEVEEQSKDNLSKSILFAIAGGFIGLIPSFVLLFALSFYSAWLFMLVPFAAFYGYKRGGAKKGKVVMPLIAVLSLLLVPGFMLYAYYLGAVFSEVSLETYITSTEMFPLFIKDMVMSVLFTLIALGVSWKALFKQTLGQVKKDLEDLR